MKSRRFIAPTLCVLVANLAFAVAAKKPKVEPIQYTNTLTIPASCDVVWKHIVPVVAAHGFMPDSSDKLGGLMKLRFTKGDFYATHRDIQAMTGYKPRFLEVWNTLRIAGASLSVVENDQQCVATIQVEYQGFESNMQKRWVALPSSGMMEYTILTELAN